MLLIRLTACADQEAPSQQQLVLGICFAWASLFFSLVATCKDDRKTHPGCLQHGYSRSHSLDSMVLLTGAGSAQLLPLQLENESYSHHRDYRRILMGMGLHELDGA